MGLNELAVENESTAPEAESARQNGTLHGHWLLLARCVGAVLTVFLLAFLIANLPVYFAQLQTVCVQTVCAEWQLTAANARALENAGFSIRLYAVFILALNLFSALVWFAVGAFIALRKSDDWLALLTSLLLVLQSVLELCGFLSNGTFSTPLAYSSPAWYVPSVSFLLLDILLIILVFSLFPNGRFVPGWMRWLVPAEVALTFICAFLYTSSLPHRTLLMTLITVEWLLVMVSIIAGQVYRYRHVSSPTERQQTKWIVFGTIVELMLGLVYIFPILLFPELRTPGSAYFLLVKPLLFLLALFGPLCFGIAILRYRLWEIDIIIHRTLVYTALSACVIGLYVLVVVGLGSLLQAQGNILLSLLATGLIAVLFQPLRQRLQQVVNRLLYGERDDPYAVLARLGSRLEATLAPDAVLPIIVETVAQALKLPYAAIRLKRGEEFLTVASYFQSPQARPEHTLPATSPLEQQETGQTRDGQVSRHYGSARGDLVRLPLVFHTEAVGELVLAPRAPGENFTPGDRALLSDLARQVGMAVHAVRLTEDLKQLTVDLQRSRERLVTAREEERRRLRRDLHDGLGPQLASLTLKLETARNRLAHDPLAETLLSDLTQRTQVTVAEIRRLVYALRPPTLDELGLVSALRELTLQYSDQVCMRLDTSDCLPELSAAIEVAIYRIAQEALTNVVRHAHARYCDIRLALDETVSQLTLSIQDDGQGLPPSRGVGMGLTSMRERTEELGGTWTIEQIPAGGTLVLTRLPYAHPQIVGTPVITSTIVPQEEE